MLIFAAPMMTQAGFFSFVGNIFWGDKGNAEVEYNSQTVQLLEASIMTNPQESLGGAEIIIVGGEALEPQVGPLGTFADVEESIPSPDQISLHVVRDGEVLSQIAKMYGVSVNTIRWANEIDSKGTINPGQTLIILPISGIKYSVKSGDTLSSISKKTGGDVKEIARFNGLVVDAKLAIGDEIIIPDGEVTPVRSSSSLRIARSSTPRRVIANGYYTRPVKGRRTQGFHGPYQAIDVGAPTGTPIVAMADGQVIVAKGSGWNGGYGQMVIIKHSNNSQTLYAHNSAVLVQPGQFVKKGEIIARVGSTGRSTGSHLHYEVRGIGSPIKTPILY